MLRVDLGRLGREGSVVVEGTISADDELWQESDLEWVDGLAVRLTAMVAGTGEIVARGEASGTLRQACRRCLEAVETEVDQELTLVFVSGDRDEDEEGDAYPFDLSGSELELSGAVREEMILAVNPYVVCSPECRGLCARCGANLNDGSCDCGEDEPDPRWAALRDLKSE